MAHCISVAQEIDRVAALPHPVRLEQLAPFLELAAGLGGDLADIGDVSARHRLISCFPGQKSRFRTFRASLRMKSRRGLTRSPLNVLKTSSASAASRTEIRSRGPGSGVMVVSHSCSGVISPRPLEPCPATF